MVCSVYNVYINELTTIISLSLYPYGVQIHCGTTVCCIASYASVCAQMRMFSFIVHPSPTRTHSSNMIHNTCTWDCFFFCFSEYNHMNAGWTIRANGILLLLLLLLYLLSLWLCKVCLDLIVYWILGFFFSSLLVRCFWSNRLEYTPALKSSLWTYTNGRKPVIYGPKQKTEMKSEASIALYVWFLEIRWTQINIILLIGFIE